ncbi:transcription factor HES-5-like [Polyodon spathula]|uniref:transcription factor HES-5-like n=1 Tax=Polyodon spathula TaxID=7913 RepID=UPI001B7F731E|nr:transcription factor HES-5-like [Polyodon spathula]
MAPTITAAMRYSQGHLAMTNKLRKPVVEKMRRDRINSSIEQLKTLLGKEFVKQQPDSKLEKADILEMTVCYLRQSASARPATGNEGYSRCVQEIVRFLSRDEMKTETQRKLLNHFQAAQNSPVHQTPVKEATPVKSALWRPW